VIMTRETDKFVDLGVQATMANRAGADLFINLHYNAAIDTSASGVETYSLTPAGAISTNGGTSTPVSPGHRNDSLNMLLAYQIHKSLLGRSAMQDRGLRRAAFQVLREIQMPGVLVEAGFLSNRGDFQKISNAAQRRAVARALADGIVLYKRQVERQ
jgi:N-acetylmuramoyl-L-alanine amidase